MRRDQLYLTDMIEAADAIAAFVSKCDDEEGFQDDELLKSAVLQKLTVIGEASARLSGDLKAQHTEVPWADVVGFRNKAVHAYFAMDWSIVWTTATRDVPELRRQMDAILAVEFPGTHR